MYMPMGVDNSWDFEEFKENFRIDIIRNDPDTMEFDIVGIDPAVANALRRILISEVPTMAIEHVFVVNNTSIIQVRTGTTLLPFSEGSAQTTSWLLVARTSWDGAACQRRTAERCMIPALGNATACSWES
jgi:DNA-directed RNA polymerase subunit L